MEIKVMGIEEIAAGVLKVTLKGKGHKGFEHILFIYVPLEDRAKYEFGSAKSFLIMDAPEFTAFQHSEHLYGTENSQG